MMNKCVIFHWKRKYSVNENLYGGCSPDAAEFCQIEKKEEMKIIIIICLFKDYNVM